MSRFLGNVASAAPLVVVLDDLHWADKSTLLLLEHAALELARAKLLREGTLDSGEVMMPSSVRAAIGHRLNALSEECNGLLRTAAIVGREFSEGLLSRLSDDGDGVPELLEPALDAGVIEEAEKPGDYGFTHALEDLYGNRAMDHVVELAHHYAEAAVPEPSHVEKAIFYARAAARQSEREVAWEEATRHYERAIAMAQEVGESSETEPELLTALGRCCRNAAQYDEAWGALTRAIDICRQLGDGPGFARAVLETLETYAGQKQLVPLEDEALTLLRETDLHLTAMVSVQRARWGWGEVEEGAAQQAAELAHTHEFVDVQAFLLERESHRAREELRFDKALEGAKATHDAFHQLGSHALASHHRFDITIGQVFAGRPGEADVAAAETIDCSRRYSNRFYEQAGLFATLIGPYVWCDRDELERRLDELDEATQGGLNGRLVRAALAETSGAAERSVAMLSAPDVVATVPPEFAAAYRGVRLLQRGGRGSRQARTRRVGR